MTAGIYRAGPAEPSGPPGWLRVTLAPAETAQQLQAAFAAALEFPDWYRGNWDALLDCLSDLSWRPAPGYLVIWPEYGRLAPAAWRTGFAVLREAASRRIELGLSPLCVVLRGHGPAADPDGDPIPMWPTPPAG